MEKMLLTVLLKNILHLHCHVRELHTRVENSSTSGSVLYKNKIQELVFFLDEALYTLRRNVNKVTVVGVTL